MQIKALAANTGVSADTIRHYEREGLLPEPLRRGNGYRDYDAAAQQRLVFIRNCRALDMSLAEVRPLLAWMDAPGADCRAVEALLAEHLTHVRERLRSLRALARQLRALRSACRGDEEACGIVAALLAEPPSPPWRGIHSA